MTLGVTYYFGKWGVCFSNEALARVFVWSADAKYPLPDWMSNEFFGLFRVLSLIFGRHFSGDTFEVDNPSDSYFTVVVLEARLTTDSLGVWWLGSGVDDCA